MPASSAASPRSRPALPDPSDQRGPTSEVRARRSGLRPGEDAACGGADEEAPLVVGIDGDGVDAADAGLAGVGADALPGLAAVAAAVDAFVHRAAGVERRR